VLGLKGTMSEAELHVLRARLEGGIRSKAARGELRRGLPVGFVWGEADGEVRFHPDEQVCGAIRTVFARFAELGSVRATWLWFRAEGLAFPLQATTLGGPDQIRWVTPTDTAIHHVVASPVYAGAYVYGKTRHERYVTETGQVRTRSRRLPQAEWEVLIPDHHPGFIDWATYQANQARIAANIRPQAHQPGGAVREGAALLQGIAVCGRCGRRLATHYRGRRSTPGYHCAGRTLVNGVACGACRSAGSSSIRRSRARSWPRSPRPVSRRPWPPPSGWRPTTTLRLGSGGWRWSGPATRPSRPSGGTWRWTPTTAWSPVAWSATGRPSLPRWPRPRPSWPAGSGGVPGP
jgi:Recombinase